MKKYTTINLVLALLCISLAGIGQTNIQKGFFIPGVSVIPGESLPSTGAEQMLPQITHVSAVAPDVLCIVIDACRVMPCIQIPYIADPQDIIREGSKTDLGETRNIYVVRNGFPLGTLVGEGRKTITLYERVIGIHLKTRDADLISNYLISSPTDINYNKGLKPLQVWRKSKPTNWETASWGQANTQQFSASHSIYLKLPYALKEGNSYLLNMPELNLNHTSVYYVHDPLYIRSDAVHSSQIGFRADDPDKNAFLSVWMGNGGGLTYPENLKFWLVNDKTNEKVFSGNAVIHWKSNMPEGIGTKANHVGSDLLRLDFSSFSTPGRYRVSVEGIGCSYPFDINDEKTWKHAFKIAMKGNFNHRSGIAMEPPYTDFVRPRSFHPADGVKVYQSTCSLLNSGNGLNAMGTDKGNFANLVAGKTDVLVPEAWGGFQDAGDWDRLIEHLLATRLYLELIELNPEYFKDLSLNIPESGNDLPDLLDEAIYGLDIYRRMQTKEGGIRGGVESSEHPIEGSTSWQETQTVLAYAPDHWSSYIYAGVAARAAFVLKLTGKGEASLIWEESAVKAMEWAEREYERWMKSPDYAKVTSRAKNAIPPERNLAAVELYRLTNKKTWHQIYLLTQKQSQIPLLLSDVEADHSVAAFVYARLDKTMVDKQTFQDVTNELINEADKRVDLSANNAFGITFGYPGRPIGKSYYSIPASLVLARAHYLTGDSKYLKAILRSGLFTAGANPMNLCLTTGLGVNYVQNVLHEDSRHTGQPAPIGITVFGPSETPSSVKKGTDLEKRLNQACFPDVLTWPASESYFDVFWFITQNEYVIRFPIGPVGYIWGYLASRK